MNATSPLNLRAVNLGDTAAKCAIRDRLGERYGTLGVPFAGDATGSANRNRLNANDHIIIAATSDTVTGSASLRCLTGHRDHAASFGVMEADVWQRKGGGTALVAALIDLADIWLGLRRNKLNMFAENRPNTAFYRKFGLVPKTQLTAYALRDDALSVTLLTAWL